MVFILVSLFLITVIVLGLCALGGCYICNQTEREYIKNGIQKTSGHVLVLEKEGAGK